MQCEKFEARLQDLLDQRARPELDAQLLEHADNCDECRDTLALQERLFTGLEIWEAPRLPDSFAADVVARHMASVTPTQVVDRAGAPGKIAWQVLAGVVAASLLVAVITIAARRGNEEVIAPPTVVLKTPVSVNPTPETIHTAAPVPQAINPSEEIGLPDHLAMHFVSTAPEFLDGHTTGRMIREVTNSFPEVAIVEENIPGIRPITSSFTLTIGMVRRTLPGGQESSAREAPKSPVPVKPRAEAVRAGHFSIA